MPAESEQRSARGSGYAADYLGSAEPVPETKKRTKTASTTPGVASDSTKDGNQLRGMVDDSSGFALAEAREEAVPDGYPPVPAAAAPTKSSLPDPATSDFHLGKEAYARGDCNTAIAAFQRVVGQPSSPPAQAAFAMHHIGACEKRQGHCAKAVEWYEKLLKRYSRYKYKADALWEAAGCYRRLGQVNRARALLRQLAPISGWETKVKQELERLDK